MSLSIPGYRIQKPLGTGGMAVVYLAQQAIFERQVALKVLSNHLAQDPSFGQRFLREAKIVSQLSHPNIITVFDVGVYEQTYYMSMEYIAGPDLKQAQPSLSLPHKFSVMLELASALQYAASKGIVHRDIKPENILLRPETLSAVLMDFGIARATKVDLAMTQTGMTLGTPHYMSPEQAKGLPVDARSDLYSLGVVFYFLLTGDVPYHADSAVAIGIKHITEPVPQLPNAWQMIQPLFDKLLAKEPQQRYSSAKEFIHDLKAVNIKVLEVIQKNHPLPIMDAIWPSLNTQDVTHIGYEPLKTSETYWDAFKKIHITWMVWALLLYKRYWPWFNAQLNKWTIIYGERLNVRSLIAVTAGMLIVLLCSVWLMPKLKNSSAALPPIKSFTQVLTQATPPPSHEIYSTAAAQIIRLSDISEFESIDSASGAGPIGALKRFKSNVQQAFGRGQRQNLTLTAKVKQLRQESHSLEAQDELAQLVKRYFEKAHDFFNQGDFNSANAAATRSEILFPESVLERQQLVSRLVHRSRIELWLIAARNAVKNEQWTTPKRKNAMYFYRQALKEDDRLAIAQQGVQKIKNLLIQKARYFYTQGDEAMALQWADALLAVQPNDPQAQQLKAAINSKHLEGDAKAF